MTSRAGGRPWAVWFVLLAIWVSYPLVLNPGGQIPGRGAEDNISSLWNFWWFRHALSQPTPLFETSHLFAPFGTSLIQHTHTALPALAGATLLGWMPLVAAHTTILLAGLAANGLGAYALAYYFVKRVMPAVLAGVVFASSAFVTLRLLGHVNLVHAWVCPLAALAWIACLDRATFTRGVLAGAAFAAVAWSDYYHTVFCSIFAVAWWLAAVVRVDVRWSGRQFPRLERVLLVLAAVAAIALAAAILSDGVQFRVLGTRVSISNARNPIAILWVLAIAGVLLRARFRPRLRSDDASIEPRAPLRTTLVAVTGAVVVGTILILPLVSAAAAVFRTGDYLTPPRHWQSGPQGVDFATLVLGNPVHSVYGPLVQRVYRFAAST